MNSIEYWTRELLKEEFKEGKGFIYCPYIPLQVDGDIVDTKASGAPPKEEIAKLINEEKQRSFIELTRQGIKEIPQLINMLEKDIEDRQNENKSV